MNPLTERIRQVEFKYRIFISFGIVIFVSALSFITYAHLPSNALSIGKFLGLAPDISISIGFLIISIVLILASALRIWAGSSLSSQTMMSFQIKTDSIVLTGPYHYVRNPIYLADFIAFCGFTMCLPPIGILLPVLLYLHYSQLIKYEEKSFLQSFPKKYGDYLRSINRFFPSFHKILQFFKELKTMQINYDGFRHNGLYILFIPGFIISAFTHNLLPAILIGLPAVIDWAILHTIIGLKKTSQSILLNQDLNNNSYNKTKKIFSDILYAQCWEDPQIDRTALNISQSDTVLSITSGGCNVLSFLLDNPRKIIALDFSPYQNYLLSLKIAAFKILRYNELLEFMGVKSSHRRTFLYAKVRNLLKQEVRIYWDRQIKKIERGIIHCGRYERYMQLLRSLIRIMMGKVLVAKFFKTEDKKDRRRLFYHRWENIWWWVFTRILLSRTFMSLFFDKSFFTQLEDDFSFGKHFANKAVHALTQLPIKENYFLAYILLGNYFSESFFPPYLRKENYPIIRQRLDRIEMVTDSCENYLSRIPNETISKFNFSNIFEWMSLHSYQTLLKEIIRVAKDGAIMTYRNLLVHRERPATLNREIDSLRSLANQLLRRDLSFIYNNYVIEKIVKQEEICHIRSEQYQTVGR